MPAARSEPCIIVGAGLVGSLLACYLARRGRRVDVFERRPDPRSLRADAGRTIAMSLSDRGWAALAAVGLDEKVRRGAHPKTARCVHRADGTRMVQQYGRDGDALWTVNRRRLNGDLVEAAEQTGLVTFHFSSPVEDVDLAAGRLSVVASDGGLCDHDFGHLFGADGMNSRLRALLRGQAMVADELTTLAYQYYEVNVPPRADGGWGLPADQVHIWPREDRMLVALPDAFGSFTGTIFTRRQASILEAAEPAVRRADTFRAAFTDLTALVPDLDRQLAANPASDIRAVRCSPWSLDERVMLIGDACHAIVPFYAMGMNTGFEDCAVFDRLLGDSGGILHRAIAGFEAARKPDTDAIGDLSLRNFASIGRASDPEYDRRWRIERALWFLFPDRWTPLYAMIHFGHCPLREVLARHEEQGRVLDEVAGRFAGEPDDDLAGLADIARPFLP